MSPEKLKKSKLKEKKSRKTPDIIKESQTLENEMEKTNKKNHSKDTVERLNLEKKISKLGVKKGEEKIHHADFGPEHEGLKKENKSKLGSEKKRRREKGNELDASNEEKIEADEYAAGSRHKKNHTKRSTHSQTSSEDGNLEKPTGTSNRTKTKAKKVKKELKHKKKKSDIVRETKSEETLEIDEEKVEEIPSVDEDCSQGMKKWLIKHKESRPGLKILQDRIDDFITAYEEQQEQEKKEREALAAEGGWTVVVHHKGRKKTTDTESGVTVGSVAQAAVVDKMGKKRSKEAPLDFYRFQKREAKRNEVMMLQSKFEQDRKRIQQLRAARKFRPY